jgi:hypothetical protein
MKNQKVKVTSTEFNRTSTAEVQFDGQVYRWTSNNRVPPSDAIKKYGIDKLPMFHQATHDIVREEETLAALEEYRERMKDYKPSAEELYEMRAAFGPGVTVVNAITGKKFRV